MWGFYCVLLSFFKAESHEAAQSGLELKILLPPPLECWDLMCVPICHTVYHYLIQLEYLFVGFESRLLWPKL